MRTYGVSASLVIGLAAYGLVLVVAGVRAYRRIQAKEAAESAQESSDSVEKQPEVGSMAGEGSSQPAEANISGKNVPRDFFLLLLVLTIPFYLLGGRKLPLPVNLPTSALMFFSLITIALVVSYRQAGRRGVQELLKKAVDFWKIKPKIWYLPSLLLMPLIYALSYAIMVWTGAPLPEPEIPLLAVLAFTGIFLLEAILEELGFQGVVFDPMQARWGALKAAILLGFAWQLWHLIPLLQAGNPPGWIFWHILEGVALRVLIVWVYSNTGKSVFTSILMHTSVNVSWSLFPNYGSGYNPLYTAVLTWLAAALVTYGWGGKTLRRFRFAGANQS